MDREWNDNQPIYRQIRDRVVAMILDGVLKEVAARNRTVVMTSHDLARVADLATRFDVLSRGAIVASVRRSEIEPNNLLAFYRQAIQEA